MESEYRLSPLRRFISLFFAILCFGCFGVEIFRIFDIVNSSEFQRYFFLPLSAFVFFIGAIRNIFEYLQVIRINANDLYYRAFGYSVSVHWKNIKKIVQRGMLKYDCLIVDKSTEGVKIWFPGELWGTSETPIPISSFDKNWRDSDLGRQIKQYAPHLFQ